MVIGMASQGNCKAGRGDLLMETEACSLTQGKKRIVIDALSRCRSDVEEVKLVTLA